MATIDEIKQQAAAVKNATQVGENTAERVGGALAGLADIAKAHEDNIGKKADKAAMDVELGKKADKEEMNRLLATKANTTDVDTKFTEEKKRVDAELDKKANAEEVDSSLKELQNTVFPLQVSLSLDKTLFEFTGNGQTVKASYSIKRKDVAITPTSLALSVNGTMQEIDIKASDTISIEVNKEGESTLVLTAKHGDLVKSATAKVVMVLPIYFGFGTSEADVAIAGNKLGPRTSANGVYEKTSAKDNVNFIILVPKTLPRLTSFTMGGAPCVMDESSVAINGKNYYMYKTAAVYMTGATLKVQAG